MNKKLLALLLIAIASACQPVTPAPAATQTPRPTRLPTATIAPTATNPAGLPFDPALRRSADCQEAYTATIRVTDLNELSNADIIRRLLENYLSHYKTPERGAMCRIEDYFIDNVTNDPNIDFLAKEQNVAFVARVIFSVQMPQLPSDWVAGNGEFGEEGWINHKAMIVGAYMESNEYLLKLIGTGP